MVLKRIFDMFLSTVGLVLLFPFLMVMAVLVKVKLGSPVFFIQERVGKDNIIYHGRRMYEKSV